MQVLIAIGLILIFILAMKAIKYGWDWMAKKTAKEISDFKHRKNGQEKRKKES